MPDRSTPSIGSDRSVRIPLRPKPWITALLLGGGGLTVAVVAAAWLAILANAIRSLVDHSLGGFALMLVFALLAAVPFYFFIRVGIAMIQAARSAPSLVIAPGGLALNDGRILAWQRISSISVSAPGRQAVLVVRATPQTNGEALFGGGGTFQWCRVALRRMRVERDELVSLLVRLSPESQRTKLSIHDR
jgi:hypothetical protein